MSTIPEEERLGVSFADLYDQRMLPATQRAVAEAATPAEGAKEMVTEHSYASGWLTQYKVNLTRNLTSYWRNPAYNSTRLPLTNNSVLIAGAFYWSVGDTTGQRRACWCDGMRMAAGTGLVEEWA